MRGYILAWAHRIEGKPKVSTVVGGGGGASGASVAAEPTTTTTRKVPNGVTVGHRSYQLQVIDYAAGKQGHVCRGVWSSELHNQCDMVEMASIVAGFIAGFTLETRLGP